MLQQLGINPAVLVVQVVAFLVLFAVLYHFLFKKVAAFMRSRTEEIDSTFKKIENDRREVDRMTQEYQARLANIEKETYQKIQEAVREGTTARAEIIAQAQAAAQKELERARAEIKREQEKCLLELRQDVIRLALRAAEKVIEQKMDEKTNAALVDNFLREIDKVK